MSDITVSSIYRGDSPDAILDDPNVIFDRSLATAKEDDCLLVSLGNDAELTMFVNSVSNDAIEVSCQVTPWANYHFDLTGGDRVWRIKLRDQHKELLADMKARLAGS